jgi:hypothetical protein
VSGPDAHLNVIEEAGKRSLIRTRSPLVDRAVDRLYDIDTAHKMSISRMQKLGLGNAFPSIISKQKRGFVRPTSVPEKIGPGFYDIGRSEDYLGGKPATTALPCGEQSRVLYRGLAPILAGALKRGVTIPRREVPRDLVEHRITGFMGPG